MPGDGGLPPGVWQTCRDMHPILRRKDARGVNAMHRSAAKPAAKAVTRDRMVSVWSDLDYG